MEYRVCRNNPAPYNDLNGKISLLGLGTMRLPLRDAADQTSIDEEKAQEIFDYVPLPFSVRGKLRMQFYIIKSCPKRGNSS